MQPVSKPIGVTRGKAVALRTARPLLDTAAAFVLAHYVARTLPATSEPQRSRAIPDGMPAV